MCFYAAKTVRCADAVSVVRVYTKKRRRCDIVDKVKITRTCDTENFSEEYPRGLSFCPRILYPHVSLVFKNRVSLMSILLCCF